MKKLENVKSVLIIRSGALGDAVYATSIIGAIKEQFGNNVSIDWIGTPLSQSLFEFDKRINKVILLKHRKLPLLLNVEKLKIVLLSIKNPYDLVINLELGSHFSDLTRAIKAKTKVGEPYNSKPKSTKDEHMVDSLKRYCSEIIQTNILKNSYPQLFGEEISIIEKKFTLPKSYIVINPSNSHTNRNKINYRAWPAEKWKTLINSIDTSIQVILIGNKGEETYFDSLKPFNQNIIDLSAKTNLTELIGIIKHAKYLITTDTGPAHIASATNTPVYCLIGPTKPSRTGPYKTPINEVNIITKNVECSPCYNTDRIKNCTDNICMKEISVEDVLNTLP